jgi:hypothetical protein
LVGNLDHGRRLERERTLLPKICAGTLAAVLRLR